MNLIKILNNAGFKTVEGYNEVNQAIINASNGKDEKLCSGYKVFPDGDICNGCRDCEEK